MSRPPSSQTPKSTTRKLGCAGSSGTSRPGGMAVAACCANSGVRVRATISFAARTTSSVNSRVKKTGVSQIRKSAGQRSVCCTQCRYASYLAGEKSALNRARWVGSIGRQHDTTRGRRQNGVGQSGSQETTIRNFQPPGFLVSRFIPFVRTRRKAKPCAPGFWRRAAGQLLLPCCPRDVSDHWSPGSHK